MITFTSSVYLGLRHTSDSLRPWARFTTGMPDALAPAPRADLVARSLADLMGTEAATLSRSTLHAFVDIGHILATWGARVYLDEGAYPVARLGIRDPGLHRRVTTFAHHDPAALARALAHDAGAPGQAVVVTDGLCAGCGNPAPLNAYTAAASRAGGFTVIDDTQAVGVLGTHPTDDAPYGLGGGGSMRFHGLEAHGVLVVASLAKGFGAPLAVVAGEGNLVDRYVGLSETRVHCSPPSLPDLHAAERAIVVNRRFGETLRRRLAALIRRLRAGLEMLGIRVARGMFPVQAIGPIRGLAPSTLHARLESLGIRGVLHAPRCSGPRVSLLITAAHRPSAIDAAIRAIGHAIPKEVRRGVEASLPVTRVGR